MKYSMRLSQWVRWPSVVVRAVVVWMGVFLCFFCGIDQVMAKSSGLTITSDRLEMDENREVATFIGKVVAREGEMALFADKMVVYYFKRGRKNSGGGVHKVVAVGRVVIEQAENKGHADQALYMVGDRELTLIGQKNGAFIFHGGDQLSGERILLSLGADRRIENVSVLGDGRQRVSARIMPSNSRKKVEKIEMEKVEIVPRSSLTSLSDRMFQQPLDAEFWSEEEALGARKPKRRLPYGASTSSSSSSSLDHPPSIPPKRRGE